MSEPLTPQALDRALALDGDYKALFERLLLALSPDRADAVQMLMAARNGTWAMMLQTPPGRALYLGSALSGTVTALATLGWRIVCGGTDADHLALAARRDAALNPGRVRHLLLDGRELPFGDSTFDLVIQEGGDLSFQQECRRVARGERVLIADNRLAYKRSTGVRGRFDKPGPLRWLSAALRPKRGERSLLGYRRLCGPHARAFALYPHSREYSHVVALDSPLPALTVGRMERRNRIKVIAKRLGLFPLLTPSFALFSGGRGKTRIERILAALGERIGEAPGAIEHLVATRSNGALVLTAAAEAPGGWSVHIPLSPLKRGQARRHALSLRDLPARFPDLPLPAYLFEGELEGVYLTAERRLGGVSAPQLTGDRDATRRMFTDMARILAGLRLGPPVTLTEEEFETLIGERIDRVRRLCARAETEQWITRRLERLRGELVGRRFPRVLYHADLRSKHLQVTTQGRVLGILDWGTREERFLPYVDLLHLFVHERKQESGTLPREAWRSIVRGEFTEAERLALEDYAQRLGLEPDLCRALEAAHPLLVAGMAELNWDYSRPRWLHHQYGV